MIHLCNDISETIQKPILTRSQNILKTHISFIQITKKIKFYNSLFIL